MDLICWYLYYYLLNSIIVGANTNEQPQLNQIRISDDIIQLECVVSSYDPGIKVHFFCQFQDKANNDDRCLENCDKLNVNDMKINCSLITTDHKITIKYIIEGSTMPTGHYYCGYRSKISSNYNHKNVEKPVVITSSSVDIVTKKTTPMKPSLIRIELIMVLIGIFALSFIVNVAFIIRCCIVRSYLYRYPHAARRSKLSPGWSWVTCFCLKEEMEATNVYYKTKDDPYEKIRDLASSETSKSKSSITNDYLNRPISQETEKLCFSSNNSQISRSSTFPARQSFVVHTPTDQFSISAIPTSVIEGFHPFMIQYAMDPQSRNIQPIINPNHRLSSHCIYDNVPGESILTNSSSTIPIRHFASTGSLDKRQKYTSNSHFKSSPLPEEGQINFPKFNKEPTNNEEELGLVMNDSSSVLQDFSSSEDAYLSGRDTDSLRDPVRVAKLEMSREMMAKADTLLREAHNLLKIS